MLQFLSSGFRLATPVFIVFGDSCVIDL